MKSIFWISLLVPYLSVAQITAPNILLSDINGQPRDLYQELHDGKTVVLDFFSVYCGTCITNTPALETLWQTYGYAGDSLWVWGIECFGVQDTALQSFQSSHGSTFPLFSTANDDVVIYEYNITYTPRYFVVCPDTTMKPYAINDLADGIENCRTTTAHPEVSPSGIQVYASGDVIYIRSGTNKIPVQIELYSPLGSTVFQTSATISGSSYFPLNGLKGIYFYRITDFKGNEATRGKVILE